MTMERCPVCDGRGTVAAAFYPAPPARAETVWPINGRDLCRSCVGRGYVCVPGDPDEARSWRAGPSEVKTRGVQA